MFIITYIFSFCIIVSSVLASPQRDASSEQTISQDKISTAAKASTQIVFNDNGVALLYKERISSIPQNRQELYTVKLHNLYQQSKFSLANTLLIFDLKMAAKK